MSAAVRELDRLGRRGFHAQRLFTVDGSPGALLYLRHDGEFREVVLATGDSSAIAYRTDHRVDPRDPFAAPRNFSFWHHSGDVVRVCHALFSRPGNDTAGRPEPNGL